MLLDNGSPFHLYYIALLNGSIVQLIHGHCTFFYDSLTANPQQSYHQLLNSIRDILRAKYEQKPQLSSSHPVDLDLAFTM